MKKRHLFAATALAAVLLVSGLAQAKTPTAAATATPPAAAAQAKPGYGMGMQGGPMMGANLSDENRKLLQDAMAKVREDNKETFDLIQTKRAELKEILHAPKFDKDAYTDKHEEIQALHNKMMKARTAAFAGVAEKMTPEERAKLPGPMMGGMRHGGKGMGKGMGMGMNPDCPMMNGMDAAEGADHTGHTMAKEPVKK